MWQVGFAFSRIEHALSMLITNLSELSGLAAKTERIDALFKGVPPQFSALIYGRLRILLLTPLQTNNNTLKFMSQ